ncbi:class I SAM-dependent methyltransferase [bacterium]|nr:class I SAM-dependent methyltransferase [bacterium]
MDAKIQKAFERFSQTLSKIGQSDLNSIKKEIFGQIDEITDLIDRAPDPALCREEFFRMCGLFDQSLMHRRTRSKPLGYAGDYLVIDWIYTQKTADSGLAKKIDELFHSYEAAQAVRNRKDYFIRLCAGMAQSEESRVDVLDLGCGSCRDVVEAFSVCNNGIQFHFHCVDHEPEAIEYARRLIKGTAAESRINLDCRNVFRFQTSKQYDLIWSAGICDYISDRAVSLLIKKCWRFLKKGGLFVFGNFGPDNPTRRGMELVSKWTLLHRTSADLIAICGDAGVDYASVEVDSEPLGINLFCKIKKQG